VLAGLVAVAAAVAIAVWLGGNLISVPGPGGNNLVNIPQPPQPTAAERALAQLRQAIPQEGEAIVLRVRLGADQTPSQALDAAFTAAGIGQRPASDSSTGATQVAKAYRDKLLEKFGGQQPGVPNTALNEGTIAAADAVFVEASWETLEKAVETLAAQAPTGLELASLMRVAAAPSTGAPKTAEGEGEPGSKRPGQPSAGAAHFAQRLNPGLFRLDKSCEAAAGITGAAVTPIDEQKTVRVLILVESAAP
jgi:hypothetical protein